MTETPWPRRNFEQLRRWIQWESVAEMERLRQRQEERQSGNAEQSGESLLDLAIEELHTGLGGHYLCTLVKRNRTVMLPWNRLKVGTPVVLSRQIEKKAENYQGVVSQRNSRSIQVALNQWPEGGEDRFRLDLSPDEVTRQRQLTALATVEKASGRIAQLRDIFWGERAPRFHPPPACHFYDSPLNDSQKEAVQFALSAQDIALIHGPPGTGKTTTVVEVIAQAVAGGAQVLALAPSNSGVDNLAEKLIARGQNAVRLGHPARVSQPVQEHSLDFLVDTHENMQVVRQMTREADQLLRQANRFTRRRPMPGARYDLRAEAKQLRKHARLLEQQAVDHILDQADVICATLTGDDQLLDDRQFDLVVVDEACQSTEPSCWIPVLRADKIVLAGDPCQLPPTVLSQRAAHEGFDRSLMQRLQAMYGSSITRQLDVQYRMHHRIMDFSSQEFYDASLIAHETVHDHLLHELHTVQLDSITESPLTFIDSAGADWDEEFEPDGLSRRNPAEADLILQKVAQLCRLGVSPCDIAVIAPYAAQARLLRQKSDWPDLEIDTVDGFQGREKEAVLITLVRSNTQGEIGFLADTRRMNVALTRARRKLIIVGDSSTLANHPFYLALFKYLEEVGEYRTVWDAE